jgi:diguanylate cyclase (GGDEF)-like protein/PAS domain S-box-containing protein
MGYIAVIAIMWQLGCITIANSFIQIWIFPVLLRLKNITTIKSLSEVSVKSGQDQSVIDGQAITPRTQALNEVGMITIDPKGLIIGFDAVASHIFGYSQHEVLNHNVSMLMPKSDAMRHDGYLATYSETRTAHVIGKGRAVTGKRKDGSEVPLWLAVNEVNIEGHRVFVGSIADLSKMSALKVSEIFNRRLFQESHIPMVVHDPDGDGFVDCNAAAVKVYGYASKEEVLGKTPLDVSAPIQYDGTPSAELIPKRDQVAKMESLNVFEWRHQRPNGELWDAKVHLMLFEHHGKQLLQVSLEDITEQKRLAAALQQSMAELKNLITQIPIGVYKYRYSKDGRGCYEFVSPAWCDLFELSAEEALNNSNSILERIHPEDVADFIKKNHFGLEPFLWEGRLRESTHVLWVHVEAYRTLLENGDVLANGIAYDITATKEHQDQLNKLANYDALTDIPNRALLMDRMKQAIAQAQRNKTKFAVIFLDLDGFKSVNDIYGHAVGDNLLIEIARRLRAYLRGGDTVARIGGDEFVLLFLGFEKTEQYLDALQRIIDLIVAPFDIGGHTVAVSASLGISQYPQDHVDPNILLRLADQSMYKAKQKGKNTYQFYSTVDA